MKSNYLKMFSFVAAVLAHMQTADAGVRHSRSLGGTGSNIPKSGRRLPTAGEQPTPFTPAAPNQAPSQMAPQPVQMQPSAPPVQPGQPVIVAPPVPVQIPTQMSFEPPVQIPQQQPQQPAQMQSPVQVPQQQPAQMQSPVQVPQQQPGQMQIPVQVPQQQPAQMQSPDQVPQQQPVQMQIPVQGSRQPSTQPLPQQGMPSQPPLSPAATLSDKYVHPSYGMAGCGLGSMIFKKNVRSEQWMASIINDIFIPQSIMITTGTSNCVDVDEEQMQAEQEIFIDTNLHALRLEAARGEGENLRAFADLLGCQRDGLFDTFASSSQGQHSFIFSDSQPSSIAERYREILKRSRALKSRCERLF